jgi:drug/metabolite transporter (DMT)-like permease
MTLTAVLLLLLSAVTHAGWNLVGKREHPTAAFLLVANTMGCLLLSPALVLYGRALGAFSARVWVLIGATGLCQAVYYAALAGAYRAGEISVAYPLARSTPAVIVPAIAWLLGQGGRLSQQAILGIALVVAGGFFLPMKRFADRGLRSELKLSIALALVAALGTAGYSIIDDAALHLLREAPGTAIGHTQVTLLYAFLEGIGSSSWLALFVLARERGRARLREICRTRSRQAALVGAGIYLTYTLVLISMAFVTNVSYVVAFRQLSIPLGALLGVLVLKEPRPIPKFVGVTTMLIGLVLIGRG